MIRQFRAGQQGAATAVVVFLLLVVVAGMLTTSLYTSASSVSGTYQQADHVKALMLAESALERAQHEMNNSVSSSFACSTVNALSGVEYTYDTGTFAVLSADDGGVSAGPCTVKVRGSHNGVVVVLESVFTNTGGTGYSIDLEFRETFEYASEGARASVWTDTVTKGFGETVLDATSDCGNAICGGTVGSGSMVMNVLDDAGAGGGKGKGKGKGPGNNGSGWLDYEAYSQRDLPGPIDTTLGGLLIDTTFGQASIIVGTPNAVQQAMEIRLYDSTNNVLSGALWSKTNGWANDGLWYAEAGSINLAQGNVYDKLRVYIDMRGQPDQIPSIWIDEIWLSDGGWTAQAWVIATWKQVDL